MIICIWAWENIAGARNKFLYIFCRWIIKYFGASRCIVGQFEIVFLFCQKKGRAVIAAAALKFLIAPHFSETFCRKVHPILAQNSRNARSYSLF